MVVTKNMYILHSIDSEHEELYREARAMWSPLEDLESMWCLVNIHFCNPASNHYDTALQSAMYLTTPIHHYYWKSENALPLDEDDREYSYIVLVHRNGSLMIARFGAFEPEYEEERVWHWNASREWWSLHQVRQEDETLADLLEPLYH